MKSPFVMTEETCLCSHVSSRKELHGEEQVLAADIKIVWKTTNHALAMFHPRLKSSFYDPAEGAQGSLTKDESHRPVLVFGKLAPIKLDEKFDDVNFTINVPGKKEVELEACKADHFEFELHDGGAVTIRFRIQCHPNESEVGKLAGMIQSDVTVTLEAKTALPPKGQQDTLPE